MKRARGALQLKRNNVSRTDGTSLLRQQRPQPLPWMTATLCVLTLCLAGTGIALTGCSSPSDEGALPSHGAASPYQALSEVIVPSVEGMLVGDARKLLGSSGLIVSVSKPATIPGCPDSLDVMTASGTDPAVGMQAELDSPVTILVDPSVPATGWVGPGHARAVNARGTQRCIDCHAESYCSSCHVRRAAEIQDD